MAPPFATNMRFKFSFLAITFQVILIILSAIFVTYDTPHHDNYGNSTHAEEDEFIKLYPYLYDAPYDKETQDDPWDNYGVVPQLTPTHKLYTANPSSPDDTASYQEVIHRVGTFHKVDMHTIAEILHQLVPSHELMLELNTLLQESDLPEQRELALRVLFEVLDYSAWRERVKPWACLAKQMKAAVQGEHLEWLLQEWDSRKDWWPAYHFSHFQAEKDWQQNERLAMKKAFVANILLGKGCRYRSFVVSKSSRSHRKKTKRLKKFVKKHRLKGLGR
ncbi:TATA box-binding protein-associated factor RNA polymerase I subunit A-like [Lissotriton helveticus]